MPKNTRLLMVLLADLKQTVGVHEDPGRPNRGKEVDTYARFLGLIAVAWCACYVAFKINKAAKAVGVKNPWPIVQAAASCTWLAKWAVTEHRLHSLPIQKVFVFVVPLTGGGYRHTGFGFNWDERMNHNTGKLEWSFETNEGNSNDDGSAEGYEVADNIRFDKPGMKYIDIDPNGLPI